MGEVPEEESPEAQGAKKLRRRSTVCTEVTVKHRQRRAFSEVGLLEALGYRPLQDGKVYNFVTKGGTDMLSYLKLAINTRALDRVVLSTWAANAEDLLTVFDWYRAGRIRRVDFYVSEVFQNNYKIEWRMVKDFYRENPGAGRVAVFINHTKMVLASCEEEGFFLTVLTSGNLNTNPRWEQGELIMDRGTFEFYTQYFDGIRTIEKHA